MPNPALLRDEDFREDCRMSRYEDIHPVLRRAHLPEPERARCQACGQKFDIDELTDDQLCFACDQRVKEMEEGRT